MQNQHKKVEKCILRTTRIALALYDIFWYNVDKFDPRRLKP